MATNPASLTSVYDVLVALRHDPEFRTEYATQQQQLIDSLPNLSEEDKSVLSTGTAADVQASLEAHEDYRGETVNITYRYVHI